MAVHTLKQDRSAGIDVHFRLQFFRRQADKISREICECLVSIDR